MRYLRLFTILVVFSTLVLLVVGCGSSSAPTAEGKKGQEPQQQSVSISLGTSTSGSAPYVLGGKISNLVNQAQSRVKVSPQVTAGYNENVALVSAGEMEIGQTFLSELNDAYAGKGKFSGKPNQNLRGLFTFVVTPIHIPVLENSSIKSFADLKGKRFSIGTPGMATRTLGELLLEAHGMTINDIKLWELPTGEVVGALKDGQIDAGLLGSTLPFAGLTELASTTPFRLVPIEGEPVEKLKTLMNGAILETTVPANTYKGISSDVRTVGTPAVLFSSAEVAEDIIYEFTKTFWENLDKMAASDPTFNVTLNNAIQGFSVPLHPGAEKYFREKGLVK